MHQEGFILVFTDILYGNHSPSVGPRGSILPLGSIRSLRSLIFRKSLLINTFCYPKLVIKVSDTYCNIYYLKM